jgi:NOL1/NOP2/fmu family ribosome biogenesis protein
MKIQILNNAKKKKIVAELADLGLKKIPELLVRTGKERIRAYSGDLSTEQIMEIWRMLPIEGIGLYAGKETINRNGVREVRLSVDGMHVWKEQLTDRIFVLDEAQEKEWFLGKNIELDDDQGLGAGFVSVKAGEDFVGMGKIGVDGDMLYGFLPKERRRRN